jgi:hypothetical protein
MKGMRHSRLCLDAKMIPGLPRPSQSAVNLKTANALGLAVPSSLLARADEMIGAQFTAAHESGNGPRADLARILSPIGAAAFPIATFVFPGCGANLI